MLAEAEPQQEEVEEPAVEEPAVAAVVVGEAKEVPAGAFANCAHPQRQTSRHARKLADDLVAKVTTAQEAEEVLAKVRKLVAHRLAPEKAEVSAAGCDLCCKIGKEIGAYRAALAVRQGDVQALDARLVAAVPSRKKWHALGVAISRLKWEQAVGGGADAVPDARGRPSKVKDPAWIQKVQDTIRANSQESTIWLPEHSQCARTLQSSVLSMWLECGYAKHLAWRQFYEIFSTHCGWAKHARRVTDFCDHCHLLQSNIEPGLKKCLKQACARIEQLYAGYFSAEVVDEQATTLDRARAFLKYVNQHADNYKVQRQRDLRAGQRQELQEAEARVVHHLRWEITVADA